MKTKTKSLLLLIGVIIMIGCSASHKAAKKNKTTDTTQVLKPEDNYKVWKQSCYSKLAVGDPLSFFNSAEIVLNGTFSHEIFQMQDGKMRKTTEIKNITKTVSAQTPGKLISMKKARDGTILEMKISFSNNDETYLFTFTLEDDNSFVLYGNGPLIFEGNEYKATATPNGICELLFNFKEKSDSKDFNGQAEGVRVSGTKTVTVP